MENQHWTMTKPTSENEKPTLDNRKTPLDQMNYIGQHKTDIDNKNITIRYWKIIIGQWKTDMRQ